MAEMACCGVEGCRRVGVRRQVACVAVLPAKGGVGLGARNVGQCREVDLGERLGHVHRQSPRGLAGYEDAVAEVQLWDDGQETVVGADAACFIEGMDELVGLVYLRSSWLGTSGLLWEKQNGQMDSPSTRSMRLTPHGIPTMALVSDVKETGFIHRLVTAGLRRVDRRIARPRFARSLDDVYMFPVLPRALVSPSSVSEAGSGRSRTATPRPNHPPTS